MDINLLNEIKDKLIKIQANEELGRMKVREEFIYQLVSLARYAGLPSGYRPLDAEEPSKISKPEWAGDIVAFVGLPTGQVAYFLPPYTLEYDGHGRAEKLSRIKDFIEDNYTNEDGVSHK